jgi:hypothetical protein
MDNHLDHDMLLLRSIWRDIMNMIFTTSVSTKMTSEHEAITTTLTIDTSKLSEQQVREYAAMKAVVPWQTLVRSKKAIPTTATYVLAPVGTRLAQPIDHMAALVKALGQNRAEAAAEKFGSAEAACKALEALFDAALDSEEEAN